MKKKAKQTDLKSLLLEVDKLFPASAHGLTSYNYTLGKFPSGWCFRVVNDWYKWSDKQLKHEFGIYREPEYAVQAFLDYVSANKINVMALSHKAKRVRKK